MIRKISALLLCSLLFFAPLAAYGSDYIRVMKDKSGDFEALKTLVQRFSGQYRGKTVQIDLIAAIHVAEQDYYADLNHRFRSYDAVLYELVAFPDQLSKHPVDEDKSMVSSMQLSIVDLLEFKFQLESINYHATNFVHADFSPTELVVAMRARNESFTRIMLNMIGASMDEGNTQPQQQQNWRMLMELMRAPSPARTIRLRRMFADQLAGSDKILEALNGNQGSALVHGRNERVMEVLEKELKRGRRRIAIFYGAGHMTDMEERLIRKFEVRPAGEEWLRAWNLKMPPQ